MNYQFPVFKAGKVYNDVEWKKDIKGVKKYDYIEIFYPCRLDAMAINPAAVAYNDSLSFTPGEVVVSVDIGVYVIIKVVSGTNSVKVADSVKRKVLVKHAYGLMQNIFGTLPAMEIELDESKVYKHCGFGSSSSIICAVSSAINEIMGRPVKAEKLIKYLASNHGEEVEDSNGEDLKLVQCIGGGATGGSTSAGIIIIAGKATTIAKMKFKGKVIIAIPNSFKEKPAKELMELEEQNLWKFEKTGKEFKDIIAYRLLHSALPEMANGEIKALADVVYDYRFKMGSNLNCSFVCDEIVRLNNTLKPLYEENHCKMLALSSVGPAFFALTDNDEDFAYCDKFFKDQDMFTIHGNVFNTRYKILKRG